MADYDGQRNTNSFISVVALIIASLALILAYAAYNRSGDNLQDEVQQGIEQRADDLDESLQDNINDSNNTLDDGVDENMNNDTNTNMDNTDNGLNDPQPAQ